MPSELPFVYWLIAFILGSFGIAASMILKTRNPSIARVAFLIVVFDFFVVTLVFGGLFDEELTWRIPREELTWPIPRSDRASSYNATSSSLLHWFRSPNPAPEFRGKPQLGTYLGPLLGMDTGIVGPVTDELRAYALNTNVSVTADNGAWLDTYPDAGTILFRGEKGSADEGGWSVPGIMRWPEHIPAAAQYHEMMSHIECGSTPAAMAGIDSIDNSAYVPGKSPDSERRSWLCNDAGAFHGVGADIARDPKEPWIAWNRYTTKDSWPGSQENLTTGSVYNLAMDPYENYDLMSNGAAPTRDLTTSVGRYAGQDNGGVGSLVGPVTRDFDQLIMNYPNNRRFPSGIDLIPNVENPYAPAPLLKNATEMKPWPTAN